MNEPKKPLEKPKSTSRKRTPVKPKSKDGDIEGVASTSNTDPKPAVQPPVG
jgi:hypothetical protein